MLSFTGSLKIYVAVEPCDMRKGFEGLSGLVTTLLHQDLRSGALFVFGNRRRTRHSAGQNRAAAFSHAASPGKSASIPYKSPLIPYSGLIR
jgi:transposase